jgi:Arc/MetJ family transcription regulator
VRINIILDDELVQEAFHYANVNTKRELIDLALREFVQNHRRLNAHELPGKVKLRNDYNYKVLRIGKRK